MSFFQCSSNLTTKIDTSLLLQRPTNFHHNPSMISTSMWKTIAKQAISRNRKFHLDCHCFSRSHGVLGRRPHDSLLREKLISGNFVLSSLPKLGVLEMGIGRNEILLQENYGGRFCFGLNGLCPKGYSSVAEAVLSTDVDEDASVEDEIQELLQEMGKEEKKQVEYRRRRKLRMVKGMGQRKYHLLKRRQVAIETEAWEQAAKEYKELLADMCEQKLAPNLPYIKTLFLGWFEPLRDAISKEQELIREGKNRTAYAPYFDQLPADMMSVITMHKLMALLMMGHHGNTRVVQAACVIGDAIDQEVPKPLVVYLCENRRRRKTFEDLDHLFFFHFCHLAPKL